MKSSFFCCECITDRPAHLFYRRVGGNNYCTMHDKSESKRRINARRVIADAKDTQREARIIESLAKITKERMDDLRFQRELRDINLDYNYI